MKRPLVISIVIHAALAALLIGAPVAKPARPVERVVSLVAVEVFSRPAPVDPPAADTADVPSPTKRRRNRSPELPAGDKEISEAPPTQPASGGARGEVETVGTVVAATQAVATGPDAVGPAAGLPAVDQGRGAGAAAPARDYAAEYLAIRTAIERAAKRSYPMNARKLGVQGVATIRFSVGPDGAATGIALVASSGSEVLDEAARAIVVKAGPYPAVPEPVQIPIRFSLDS